MGVSEQLSVASYQLAGRVWGDRSRPAVLLLHGFMGRGANWEAVATVLAEQYFVIAPDLPGHGASLFEDSKKFTMSAAAQLVIDLLDALQITRCRLVGYSMGGRVALYLAIHFPERFERMVLESASPGLRTAAERTARQKWDGDIAGRLEREPFEAFLAQWYAMGLFASLRAHHDFSKMVTMRLDNAPAQLAMSMREMGTGSMPSLWAGWEQLMIPTTLIVGELDAKYVEISAEMHPLNLLSTRHIIPHAGHNVHFEQPRAFIACLHSSL